MEPNASKEMIADVALGLFARKGFESVGVNEIAGKTGLTKPSLYHHFGSKDGLLQAIMEREGRGLLALTAEGTVYQHDIVMNLTRLFSATLDFARVHEDFFRLCLRLFASSPEAPGYQTGAELRSRIIGYYTGLFEAAAGDHGNMRGRAGIYAETFWGLLASCGTLAINGGLPRDPAVEFRIVHQYMHGIFS